MDFPCVSTPLSLVKNIKAWTGKMIGQSLMGDWENKGIQNINADLRIRTVLS